MHPQKLYFGANQKYLSAKKQILSKTQNRSKVAKIKGKMTLKLKIMTTAKSWQMEKITEARILK